MSTTRFDSFQRFGRTLMLPIAVLPIAGLLLRLGQDDLLKIPFMAAAGGAIFANLGILFAIGIAFGFARDQHGAAGLAGAVGYFVLDAGAKAINPAINMGVLGGIFSGLIAGALYNRYKDIKLPDWLAFFGGRRFVPIVTGIACLVLAFIMGYVWPLVQRGIDAVGHWVIGSGNAGLFLYGVLNRLFLVTGLHHVLNTFVWFVFGNFTGPQGLVHGDLNRFFAGDPTAGSFMAGFFPVMMFGLPAAALAMYRTATPENKVKVGSLLLSAALVSLATGITEPIEFAFMFAAPALYAVHAVLTGVSLVVMNLLHVKLGFTFSAGAIDYVLSYGKSQHGWMAIPVGVVYFALYYGIFTLCIRRFNFTTLGREPLLVEGETDAEAALPAARNRAHGYILALGGIDNIIELEACATRLRVSVKNSVIVLDPTLKGAGAMGVVRPSDGSIQVVVGPIADAVADEINAEIRATRLASGDALAASRS
jgi:PTS system N-acetylglucosamine-specific IIC component